MSLSKEKTHSPLRKKRSSTTNSEVFTNPNLYRLVESGLDIQTARDVSAYARPGGGSIGISPADSPMEREADTIANKIVGGQTEVRPMLKAEGISRMPDEEEPMELVFRKASFSIQRSGDGEMAAPSGFSSRLSSREGLGSPMEGGLRDQMESGFGSDLSGVRMHTGPEADSMSRDIGAKAFTYGQNIYFKSGEYNPGSSGGQKLIAHELTHTLQQSGTISPKRIQRLKDDEPKKYESAISYGEAAKENLHIWKYYVNNYNPFGEHKIYPWNNPNAFANHTYELQQKINTAWDKKGDDRLKENGIFDWALVQELEEIGENCIKGHEGWYLSKGFAQEFLTRIKGQMAGVTGQPELISAWFRGNISIFDRVRKYRFFSIKKHDSGPHVRKVQEALMALNYPLPIYEADGKLGQESVDALKDFQKDEGFAPKDITGKVDAKTLQRLDVRMFGKKYKSEYRGGGELARVFEVPVTHYMGEDEMTMHALMWVFSISQPEARVLRSEGWHLENYTEINKSVIEVGHKVVTCRNSLWEQVKGKRTSNRRRPSRNAKYLTASEALVNLEELMLALNKKGHIFDLMKKVEDAKAALAGIDRMFFGKEKIHMASLIARLKREASAKLATAQANLDAELKKYKTTTGELSGQKSQFQNLFASYAHHVAIKMLADNRTSVNIEIKRYDEAVTADNKEGEYIRDIKSILKELKTRYDAADELWWQGLSFAETGDKTKINSQSKLRAHAGNIIAGHGGYYDPAEEVKKKYYKYKPEKLGKDAPNEVFQAGIDKEKETMRFLTEKAQNYQILAYPDLKLRRFADKYSKMGDDDLRKFLLKTLTVPGSTDGGILEKINLTEKKLKADPKLIYSMGPVIAKAQEELGILPDSFPDVAIKEAIKAHNDKTFWESLGMAALGIGLGLLALVSGPVGWVALAGSIAVGVYDSYQQYQQITTAKAAKRSAMDPRKALGDTDPSYFWFYVSVLSIGLDVLDVVKLLKPASLLIDHSKAGKELAEGITKSLSEEKKVLQKSLEGADTKLTKELTEKIAKIDDAIAKIDPDELAKNFDILRHVSKSPRASLAIAEGLQQPEIAQAFTRLRAIREAGKMTEDAYINAIRYFGGIGRRYMHEMPEVLRLAEAGGIVANKQLFQELMSDSRLQKVLLDNNTNPGMLLTEWKAWKAATSGSFVDFLATKGHRVTLESGPSLTKTFGAGFSAMSIVQKNRYILREMHPELLTALNRGQLPPKVAAALETMLAKDLIGTTNDLTRATIRVERELQSVLATNLDSLGDLTKVMRMIRDPNLRKTIFEASGHVSGFPAFKKLLDDNAALITKFSTDGENVFDDLIRIGPLDDEGTLQRLIREKEFRNTLLEYPDAIKALKKCASPCFPPNCAPADIKKVAKIIDKLEKSKGSSIDYTKLNEFLYNSRGPDFSTIVATLEARTGDEIAAFFAGLKVSDLVIPASMDAVKGLKGKLQIIIASGVSPKQLSTILKNLETHGVDALSAAKKFASASRKVSGEDMKHWSTLVNALESGNPATVEASLAVLEKMGRIAKDAPGRIDKIMNGFGRNPLAVISAGVAAGKDSAKWMNLLDDLFKEVDPSILRRFFSQSAPAMNPANLARVADEVDIKKLARLVKNNSQPERIKTILMSIPADRFSKFIKESHGTTLKNLIESVSADKLSKVLSKAEMNDMFKAKEVRDLISSFGTHSFNDLDNALSQVADISKLKGLKGASATTAEFNRMIALYKHTTAQTAITNLLAKGSSTNKFEGLSALLRIAQDGGAPIADQVAALARFDGLLGKFKLNYVTDSYSGVTTTALRGAGVDDLRIGHFQQRHTWEHFDFPHFRTKSNKPTTFLPDGLHSPAKLEELAENTVAKLYTDAPGTAVPLTGTHKVTGVTNPAPPPPTLDMAIHINNNGGKFQMDMMYPSGPIPPLTRVTESMMKGFEKFFP